MKKFLNVMAVACIVITGCATNEAGSDMDREGSRIEYDSPTEAMNALQNDRDIKFRDYQGWTIAEDSKNTTTWSFTPANHPAHPAVAKNVVFERDGKVWIKTGILCSAGPTICGRLVEEFKLLHVQIKAGVEARGSQ